MVTIYEPPVRNSGRLGGKFLERTRPAKPHSTPEAPAYYGPADFYIGAVIVVFSHRFVICNADAYVLDFMEQHRDQFPRNYLIYKNKRSFWWWYAWLMNCGYFCIKRAIE